MVYDAASFEPIFSVKLRNDVTRIDFNPANTLLAAACDDCNIHIIDLDQQKVTNVLTGHEGRAWQALFNHRGDQLLSGAADGFIRVWETTTWVQVLSLIHI